MKLRILLILTIFTAILLLPSCTVTSHDFNVYISCDEFTANHHGGSNWEVEVGDKIRVELCSNPTTGFEWEYEMSNENVLREEDHEEPEVDSLSAIGIEVFTFKEPEGDGLGTADIEVWTFEAIEKGTTEVRMEYSQPWEGGLKAEWTYTMTVTVE